VHPNGNLVPFGRGVPVFLLENAMSNISVMSRAELICELIAPSHPASVAEAAATYVSPDGLPVVAPCAALVSHKLAVAREILLRDLVHQMRSGPVLDSPALVRAWLKLHCAALEHEVFIVLHLDVRNHLIQDEEMFRGTLTHTSVYPREVVKSALAHNSAALVLAHNHPSGSPEPSVADHALTQALKQALALVDVRVIDHFIVAGDRTLSFAEQSLL
jgi:DNA repair protein RadC